MKRVYLEYLPQCKAFGISEKAIAQMEEQIALPDLHLNPEHYKLLNCEIPDSSAPIIGFLMGREKNDYTADWNYVRAIIKSGVNIRFLTYEHPATQLTGCAGLILPGGNFSSPEGFYTDPQPQESLSPRAQAYIDLIKKAYMVNMPMLGICAGAQMIGGAFGLKMYRDQSYIESEIQHKTEEHNAHKVFLSDPKLRKLLGGVKWLWTNSRHNESMVSNSHDSCLNFFAFAEDGVPEAWGRLENNILCIQWHPEDGAAWGNSQMQAIYNWLAEKAKEYMSQ